MKGVTGMSVFYCYARVSTQSQDQISPDTQAERLKKDAERLGMEYVVIQEVGSGESMFGRPKFMKMLSDLKEGDVVGVWDQSRLSRSDEESFLIINRITEAKAKLMVNSKFLDIQDPQDRAIFGINSVFASYSRRLQLQKSREGIKKMKEDGNTIFAGDTFGYLLTRHGKNVSVSIIDEEAKAIRYVFEEYAKGKAMKELERELYGKVFHRPFKFNIQNIRPMLCRPLYIGKYFDTPGMLKHIMKYTEEEVREHLITSNLYPSIIDEDLYFEVFHRLRTSRVPHAVEYKQRWTVHVLSGLYKCADCGLGITFRNRYRDGKLFTTYVFQSHTGNCPTKYHTQFDALWLEKCTQACFLLTFLDGSRVGAFFKEQRSKLDVDSVAAREELTLIDKELEKTQAKKDRIIDAISDGLITKNDAQKKLEKIETEHHSLTERKNTIEKQLMSLNQDIDDLLRFSAQEIIDTYRGREREYYFRYVKSGINYHKYLVLEMMNGMTFEIHKPRRTNTATKPAVINVSVNGEQYYSFVFSPKMEIENIYSENPYMTNTLEKWRKQVNGELSQTDTIMLGF